MKKYTLLTIAFLSYCICAISQVDYSNRSQQGAPSKHHDTANRDYSGAVYQGMRPIKYTDYVYTNNGRKGTQPVRYDNVHQRGGFSKHDTGNRDYSGVVYQGMRPIKYTDYVYVNNGRKGAQPVRYDNVHQRDGFSKHDTGNQDYSDVVYQGMRPIRYSEIYRSK